MSHITDMVIITGMSEGKAMERLNAWCLANDPREQQFRRLDTDAAGGNKVFCDQVWAMAGNYFHHEDLVDALPSFGWGSPAKVLLIVDDEADSAPRVYRAVEEPAPVTGWASLG